MKATNFIKKRLQHSCFSVNFAKFLRTAFFIEHLRWLPLNKFSLYRQKQPAEVFCKKGVLRNFEKFTWKHLCQRPSFNKVAGLRPPTLFKKLWHRRFFLWTLRNFIRTPFLLNVSERLLLCRACLENFIFAERDTFYLNSRSYSEIDSLCSNK